MLRQAFLASRWLLVPMYAGLVASLALLVVVFLREVATYVPQALEMTSGTAIVAVLSLVDLVLVANLLVIVIASGVETFAGGRRDPAAATEPLGVVEFSGLKIKLVASIVAISGIELLKRFMTIGRDGQALALDDPALAWSVVVHLTFVASAVLLALMDWLAARNGKG